MEQNLDAEPTPLSEASASSLANQPNLDIPATRLESQQKAGFYDPNLASKPVEKWSEAEIKSQQEYAKSKMEQEISQEVAAIKTDTERQILDIAGETYIKITQEIGLSEQEAIGMIGRDKMIKIIGEDRVNEIKDRFDKEVMAEAVKILDGAFKEVESAIDNGIRFK